MHYRKWSAIEMHFFSKQNNTMGNQSSKTGSNSLKYSNKSRSNPGGLEIASGTSSHRGVPEPNTDICGPEANLHKHITCRKHPGHKDFIPVGKFFTQGFLPAGYRTKQWQNYIKDLCDRTVHLKVRTVSKDRPKYYPDSTDAYPFHIPGGGSRTRTGSGWVYDVYECGEGGVRYRDQTCDCDECKASQSPVKKWWQLEVITAAHVICETTEAKDAEVTLFYDDKDSETFVVKGHDVEFEDIKGDIRVFKVIVHDDGIGQRLDRVIERCVKFRRVYGSTFLNFLNWTFVISHPHGCSKHITIGYFVKGGNLPGRGLDCFYHNASTCPGSSGGLVVGRDGLMERYDWVFPHSEAMPDGTNKTGYGWFLS